MPDTPRSGPDTRFSADLRDIREARNVSLSDIHEETKIPIDLLQQFEDTGLFDHQMFNRVYLRSLVRTYAEMVEIDADEAVRYLESALAGTYAGELAAQHLGAADEAAPADAPASDNAARDEPAPEEPTSEEPAPEEASAAASTPDEPTTDEPPAAPSREASRQEQSEPRRSAEASASRAEGASAAGAGAASASASATSPSVRRAADAASGRRPSPAAAAAARKTSTGLWVGIAVVMVAIVAGIAYFLLRESEPAAEPEPTAAVADTTAAAASEPAPAPPQPVSVPDTMAFVVTAARGKVDHIKVTVDDDVRRPYWIEQGQSRTFEVTDRIVFENPSEGRDILEVVDIRLGDAPVSTDERDDRGRVVVDRERARALLRASS